jgi:hypothetical protein
MYGKGVSKHRKIVKYRAQAIKKGMTLNLVRSGWLGKKVLRILIMETTFTIVNLVFALLAAFFSIKSLLLKAPYVDNKADSSGWSGAKIIVDGEDFIAASKKQKLWSKLSAIAALISALAAIISSIVAYC